VWIAVKSKCSLAISSSVSAWDYTLYYHKVVIPLTLNIANITAPALFHQGHLIHRVPKYISKHQNRANCISLYNEYTIMRPNRNISKIYNGN
jgi:hypothetical protein